MRNLDGSVLVSDGHAPRADVIAEARAFMLAAGMDETTVDDLLVDRPGLIGRAWWSEDHGFCNAPNDDNTHQDPQPVTVVHVEVPA